MQSDRPEFAGPGPASGRYPQLSELIADIERQQQPIFAGGNRRRTMHQAGIFVARPKLTFQQRNVATSESLDIALIREKTRIKIWLPFASEAQL